MPQKQMRLPIKAGFHVAKRRPVRADTYAALTTCTVCCLRIPNVIDVGITHLVAFKDFFKNIEQVGQHIFIDVIVDV